MLFSTQRQTQRNSEEDGNMAQLYGTAPSKLRKDNFVEHSLSFGSDFLSKQISAKSISGRYLAEVLYALFCSLALLLCPLCFLSCPVPNTFAAIHCHVVVKTGEGVTSLGTAVPLKYQHRSL